VCEILTPWRQTALFLYIRYKRTNKLWSKQQRECEMKQLAAIVCRTLEKSSCCSRWMCYCHDVERFYRTIFKLYIPGRTGRTGRTGRPMGFVYCRYYYFFLSMIFAVKYFKQTMLLGNMVLYLFCRVTRGGSTTALRYKPGGRGFDSIWCHWNFSLKVILPVALWSWNWLRL
jgi:hypothetical protein